MSIYNNWISKIILDLHVQFSFKKNSFRITLETMSWIKLRHLETGWPPATGFCLQWIDLLLKAFSTICRHHVVRTLQPRDPSPWPLLLPKPLPLKALMSRESIVCASRMATNTQIPLWELSRKLLGGYMWCRLVGFRNRHKSLFGSKYLF